MAESKTCPKCNGTMSPGRIMKVNEYSIRNQYLYLFAPDASASPRKPLVAYCCDQCGFVEFYGQADS
jgi:hypothetical protein